MKVVLAVLAAAIASTPGSIAQLSGSAGCINSRGTTACAKARGVANPFALVVSPDGRNVYAAGGVGSLGSVGAFSRDRSGRLRQLAGKAGCVFQRPSRVCGTGRGLETAAAVAVSPNGRLVVTAARNGRAIGIYRRTSGGALVSAGCFQTRAGPGCREASALAGANGLAFSPDGRFLLVAARAGGLAVFAVRGNTLAPAGCFNALGSRGCTASAGLVGPNAVAFASNSEFAYVVSGGGANGSIVMIGIGADGGMQQLHCIAQGRVPAGCVAGRGLQQPAAVAVSPDGRHVYVASTVSAAVSTFERTGAVLIQRAVYSSVNLRRASGVAVTPNGKRVLASASRSLVAFARSADGALTVVKPIRPRGLSELTAIAVSRDGRNAYVAGRGIAVLRLS